MELSDVVEEKPKRKSVMEAFAQKGGDVTAEQIINELILVDEKAIPVVTEINLPMEMSILDTLEMMYHELGWKLSEKFMSGLLKAIRINMMAYKRKRVVEVMEGYVAVSLQNLLKKEGTMDALFGDKR